MSTEAESEDKEETTENEPSDPEPTREMSKLAKDAYPKIVDTSHGRRVLLSNSPGGHTCLLCREGGQCLGQQDMQAHLEKKHGRFFKERWKEFSSLQCRICEKKLEGKDVEAHTTSVRSKGQIQ